MKVQRISGLQHTFSFLSSTTELEFFRTRFLASDLGKIYQAIPWTDLENHFNIKSSSKGPNSIFSPQGKIALMILKHYACCSDRKLMEQLNSNIDYQFFCDIHLGLKRLGNYKIVSQIRTELSSKLYIEVMERILYGHWAPYINEPEKITTDATCYESEVRYPTDQKLLWESVDWLYKQIKQICKALKLPLSRTKYIKWKKRYISYSKTRKIPTRNDVRSLGHF